MPARTHATKQVGERGVLCEVLATSGKKAVYRTACAGCRRGGERRVVGAAGGGRGHYESGTAGHEPRLRGVVLLVLVLLVLLVLLLALDRSMRTSGHWCPCPRTTSLLDLGD